MQCRGRYRACSNTGKRWIITWRMTRSSRARSTRLHVGLHPCCPAACATALTEVLLPHHLSTVRARGVCWSTTCSILNTVLERMVSMSDWKERKLVSVARESSMVCTGAEGWEGRDPGRGASYELVQRCTLLPLIRTNSRARKMATIICNACLDIGCHRGRRAGAKILERVLHGQQAGIQALRRRHGGGAGIQRAVYEGSDGVDGRQAAVNHLPLCLRDAVDAARQHPGCNRGRGGFEPARAAPSQQLARLLAFVVWAEHAGAAGAAHDEAPDDECEEEDEGDDGEDAGAQQVRPQPLDVGLPLAEVQLRQRGRLARQGQGPEGW